MSRKRGAGGKEKEAADGRRWRACSQEKQPAMAAMPAATPYGLASGKKPGVRAAGADR